MDANERRQSLIELLREENAEARRELARRKLARESNPTLMHEWLMASEPMGAALMRKNDNPAGLVFKTSEHAMLPAPQPEPAPFNEAQVDVMAHVINGIRDEWQHEHAAYMADRNVELARLQVEIDDLRGQLNSLLRKSENATVAKSDVVDFHQRRK
jgi:hypothetical protein